MTQPYLFISFTALLLTPGTRKRPPQSGSVQTFIKLASRFKGDDRVHPISLALGDLQGTATINRGRESITDSMLLRENRTGETITIQTDTVDNFCAANSISNIDILKVDVEGMEARVFAGASGMFRKQAIRAVFTEVFFSPTYQAMPLFWDLHAVLAKAGFSLYGLYFLTRQPDGRLELANALYTLTERNPPE